MAFQGITMTKNRSLLLCLMFLSVATYAQAQQTIISPSRSADWRNVGISGGIPNRTTICSTLSSGATSTQVNSAIAACPSGQVVKLNAGTYNLSGGINFNNKSNVTLRGAGANQTFIVFGSGSSLGCHGLQANVCMDSADTNWPGGPSNSANWTAGYAKGTTVITLSSTANLSVGDPLILDQADDSSDNGGIFVCGTGVCNDDGPGGGPSGGQRSNRQQQQLVTVTAINGTQVTISPGLYMPNWRSSQNPGAFWATSPIFNSGIEDVSLDHTATSGEQAGVGIFNCSGCWVKGIRSINSAREHVWIYDSLRVVVRDSYFYGTKNSVSQSYGVEAFPSSDALIENNIFQRITAPLMINASCSGCVLSYNFSINDFYSGSVNWLMQAVHLHAGGLDNVLIEGNVGAGVYGDLFHGTHHFITIFRNRYNGFEVGKTDQTSPLPLWPYSRFFNIVGNVLGDTRRPHTTYQTTPSGGSTNVSIYSFGTGTVTCCQGGDNNVLTTVMRWGNYDTLNGAVRFVTSEVPSTLSGAQAAFSNPVPAQVLPASMYLPGKPNWWPSSKAWPPIGPDVTGGNIANVGGHAYTIPAQDCYTGMGGPAEGTGSVLSFNAANCYTSSGVAAPTNLRIIR
jgi:hypothetical protein